MAERGHEGSGPADASTTTGGEPCDAPPDLVVVASGYPSARAERVSCVFEMCHVRVSWCVYTHTRGNVSDGAGARHGTEEIAPS